MTHTNLPLYFMQSNPILFASNMGSLLGVNKYKPRAKLLIELLEKHKYLSPPISKKRTFSYAPRPCSIGISKEKEILDLFCAKYGLHCYSAQKHEIHLDLCSLRGKCDGISGKGDLIEVKCRMNHIHDSISPTDYAQVQSYLRIYNMNNCIFVQCLQNDSNVHIEHIPRNDEYWNSYVVPEITYFFELFEFYKHHPHELHRLCYLLQNCRNNSMLTIR